MRGFAYFAVAGLAMASITVSQGVRAAPATKTLYTFQDIGDGQWPSVQEFDEKGNLYGFTVVGGPAGPCVNGCGTVFKLAPDGTKTVLHAFNLDDGGGVRGIVRDAKGNIFGTTQNGGRYGFGTIFKLAPDGSIAWSHSLPAPVHGYSVAPKGIWPMSGVIIGYDGNLYGTAWHGGINNHCGEGGCGVVFRIRPNGSGYTVLYAFKGAGDGCAPYGGVTMDRAGNLYGTTQGCGNGNYGTVYKLDPSGVETVLHVFAEGLDGNDPISAPVLDEQGNLYGATLVGGGEGCGDPFPVGPGCGIIYKIAPDGTETVLYRFLGAHLARDGADPGTKLYRDDNGDLYGETSFGGERSVCQPLGCGTVFRLRADGSEEVLHRFHGPRYNDGAFGTSPVIKGRGPAAGALFGAANIGPADCCGQLIEIVNLFEAGK